MLYRFVRGPGFVVRNGFGTYKISLELQLTKSAPICRRAPGFIAYFDRAVLRSTDQVIEHSEGENTGHHFLVCVGESDSTTVFPQCLPLAQSFWLPEVAHLGRAPQRSEICQPGYLGSVHSPYPT